MHCLNFTQRKMLGKFNTLIRARKNSFPFFNFRQTPDVFLGGYTRISDAPAINHFNWESAPAAFTNDVGWRFSICRTVGSLVRFVWNVIWKNGVQAFWPLLSGYPRPRIADSAGMIIIFLWRADFSMSIRSIFLHPKLLFFVKKNTRSEKCYPLLSGEKKRKLEKKIIPFWIFLVTAFPFEIFKLSSLLCFRGSVAFLLTTQLFLYIYIESPTIHPLLVGGMQSFRLPFHVGPPRPCSYKGVLYLCVGVWRPLLIFRCSAGDAMSIHPVLYSRSGCRIIHGRAVGSGWRRRMAGGGRRAIPGGPRER